MAENGGQREQGHGLRSKKWRYSYKTSALTEDGRPVNILHDFYIPVLRRSTSYDRMAGYFRSSSLAAASQGFSSFVGREGKIRLVVGADLDPEDVQAILNGDQQRYMNHLNGELEQAECWPEDVTHGVQLLGWMVAHGHLEVRVAFRVHSETGEALRLTATDDGYVHEKWAIFADEADSRLYASGSLNESRTALEKNAENIDVHCDWWGGRDLQRVEDAQRDFDNIWEGHSPSIRIMSLPDAVRERLIALGDSPALPTEIDGTSAAPREVTPPSPLERLRFAVVQDGPQLPGGRYVGLATAPVTPWPHQAVVARRLVEAWPFSYLLCDEVGLGKTIEAGLAIRSLLLSGLVNRVLIAAPASLTRQWQRQLADKLLLSFGRTLASPTIHHSYIFPFEEERPSSSLYEPNLSIASTGLLSRHQHAQSLQRAREFDIVLVDEAHAARRKNPQQGTEGHPSFGNLYQAIHRYVRPQAKALWLATATPMQIDPVEVCDLLALTNRVGPFQFDPSLTLQYYEILGRLVRDESPGEPDWDFLRRSVQTVEAQDPLLWQFLQQSAIDGRIRVPARQWLEARRTPRGTDLKRMLRLIFAASPLSRVMLRHTRSLLEIYRANGQLGDTLASRTILPIPSITFNEQEQSAYEDLESYCKELVEQIQMSQDARSRTSLGFYLSFLRLRFASSLFAIRETLRRRLEKVEATLRHHEHAGVNQPDTETGLAEEWLAESEDEDDREAEITLLKDRSPEDLEWERGKLKEMFAKVEDFHRPSSKMQHLLGVIQRRRIGNTSRVRQMVVFSRFLDTVTDIVRRLRSIAPHMLVGTYSGAGGQYVDARSGRLRGVEREEVKHLFLQGQIDVLVCTDAAAEGLNLQTADLLVNFDLGWNPMKVEQRIGRIDRIGQKHDEIFVLNLCYAGSAEETVYGRLLQRLADASLIVGRQQVSMLPVEPDEFRELAEGTLTPVELEHRAKERLSLQQRRTESMEVPPKDLYEIYQRLSQEESQHPLPVTLESIWGTLTASRYLRDLGCTVSADQDTPTMLLSGIEDAPHGVVLTPSRKTYEEGIPGTRVTPHFASYGDPFFHCILDQASQFELPKCARRLAVSVENVNATMVGYAVSCLDDNGLRHVRLVTSLKDSENIQLCEDEPVTDAEADAERAKLQHMAEQEFRPCTAAALIERRNQQAGWSQLVLDYLVIRKLIRSRARYMGDEMLFWPVIKSVAELVEDRDGITIPDLPADLVRPIKKHFLFDAETPRLGDKGSMLSPAVLMKAGIDAAKRIADSFHEKKSELRTDSVLNSIERAVEECRRKAL